MTEPPKRRPGRIQIQEVSPSLDGGRWPVKRTLGEPLEVSATIFADGHDVLEAALLHRGPEARRWTETRMEHLGNDRFTASIEPETLGRWQYSIAAWIDRFASWHHELERKVESGQADLAGELAEGAALLGVSALTLDEALEAEPPLLREAETRLDEPLELIVDRERARFGAWYELFPRSFGGFAGVERALPELAELGFDVVYFPPIHPIGTTQRKGRNNALEAAPGDPGSPWAIGSPVGGHDAISPELGTLADLERLVESARVHELELALDLALQCSPDHPWLKEHPEWFYRRPDGTLKYAENPPKRYQDIYNLNFDSDDWQGLWQALLELVLTWAGRGIRIFRVDNPHTKPVAFWSWLIRESQAVHPDLIFLAEAFTRPAMMATLAKAGFSQSYTYFTWRNTRWELIDYITELTASALPEFFRPNFFANTPDILTAYLQEGGRPAFEARLVLAATLSPSYGIYSGFENLEREPVRAGSEEYLDSEKYELKSRKLDGPLLPLVAKLNAIRRQHPSLQRLDDLTFLNTANEQLIAYLKQDGDDAVLVVVNLDAASAQTGLVTVPGELDLPASFAVTDLLTGGDWTWRTGGNYVKLVPGERQAHVLGIEL
ncbi:MAG TPA: alpha-1,4-glucan--maltose-1-phosphate maltosyltransferase [Gaiellaceae bacterium]|nr:alpha-1,4-glucan--maltose-1-phosphate maltosyltransferase [Gaiellaceae bacterium]